MLGNFFARPQSPDGRAGQFGKPQCHLLRP
jgi:hypothetical protein